MKHTWQTKEKFKALGTCASACLKFVLVSNGGGAISMLSLLVKIIECNYSSPTLIMICLSLFLTGVCIGGLGSYFSWSSLTYDYFKDECVKQLLTPDWELDPSLLNDYLEEDIPKLKGELYKLHEYIHKSEYQEDEVTESFTKEQRYQLKNYHDYNKKYTRFNILTLWTVRLSFFLFIVGSILGVIGINNL